MNETIGRSRAQWFGDNPWIGRWTGTASVATRVLGAAFAFGIALGEAYDRTQVVATVAGLFVLASLMPAGRATPVIAGLGAGLLVFTASALIHEPLGILMLVAGVAAWIALSLQRAGHDWQVAATAAGFLGGAGVTLAIAVAVALAVEG